MDTKAAYSFGYDAGLNGPNEINCSFRIFSDPEFTKAWERGKAKGEKEKQKKSSIKII